MNTDFRKRLDKIESTFIPREDENGVVFIPLKGESNEDCADRIARWQAGEVVEGQERVYTGRARTMRIRFVKAVCPKAA